MRLFGILCLWCMLMATACKTPPPGPPDEKPVTDTTSHAVVWRTDTIGWGGSGGSDIAIIDENNIWAVGYFYMRDSTGKIDADYYNAVHWDGVKWTPKKLYYIYQGKKYKDETSAIIAFSKKDIWIGSGSAYRFDGLTDTMSLVKYPGDLVAGIRRFWGTSSNNLYMIGRLGQFTYFDGIQLHPIATGVTSQFNDIFGFEERIYISSINYDYPTPPSGLFLYENNTFQFLLPSASDTGYYSYLQNSFAVWVSPTGTVWQTGNGRLFRPLKSREQIVEVSKRHGWLLCLRGLADNDVWAAGVLGIVSHYNGSTWREYEELASVGDQGEYHAMAVKGNIVALAGVVPYQGHALLTIGRRVQ